MPTQKLRQFNVIFQHWDILVMVLNTAHTVRQSVID